MNNITDVIEYLIQQKRKDLADVIIRELKDKPRVIEREIVSRPMPSIQPITINPSPTTDPWHFPRVWCGDPPGSLGHGVISGTKVEATIC